MHTSKCFSQILKMRKKNIIKSVIFFVIVSILQREDIHLICHDKRLKYQMGAKRPKSQEVK